MRYGLQFLVLVVVVMVSSFGFGFGAWAGVARAFRTLGFPRVRRGAVLIDAGEADEARGEYWTRNAFERGAYSPRDFPVADSV